ncbi:uncharacterized protein BXZ73DRAFT_83289, partial [Epithele typhae]|uniref:uncharacterized protein n=1 Tax=Epithele typhae TaxID=378194 RepID=UPI0020087BFB
MASESSSVMIYTYDGLKLVLGRQNAAIVVRGLLYALLGFQYAAALSMQAVRTRAFCLVVVGHRAAGIRPGLHEVDSEPKFDIEKTDMRLSARRRLASSHVIAVLHPRKLRVGTEMASRARSRWKSDDRAAAPGRTPAWRPLSIAGHLIPALPV